MELWDGGTVGRWVGTINVCVFTVYIVGGQFFFKKQTPIHLSSFVIGLKHLWQCCMIMKRVLVTLIKIYK